MQVFLKRSRFLTLRAKLLVYDSVVRNVLLYGCETWPVKVADFNRLEAFQMRCYRRLLKVSYRDRVTNAEILRRIGRAGDKSMVNLIKGRRLRWLGHVLRMDPSGLAYRALRFVPPADWSRRPGGRAHWEQTVKNDLLPMRRVYNALWHRDWWGLVTDWARDRAQWKQITDGCVT